MIKHVPILHDLFKLSYANNIGHMLICPFIKPATHTSMMMNFLNLKKSTPVQRIRPQTAGLNNFYIYILYKDFSTDMCVKFKQQFLKSTIFCHLTRANFKS